jgi:threonine dehydrogenase-like Zn-dependent dehydrogenase
MCGSDIPFFTGSQRIKHYPLAPGAPIHECVGQVVESQSPQFMPGDWVIAIPENNQALAQFFIAQSAKAVRLPTDLANSDTSCLVQPLSTVMNAVDRLEEIRGRSVTVVGLGSTGLFFCWLLHKRGAGSIVGIDPSAHRCLMAEKVGAARTFAMRSSQVIDFARQHPGEWEPPEIVIEAVGHQMETINDCLKLVQKRGTVVAFGVPDQPVYTVNYETFFRKNAQLIASVTPEWSEYLGQAANLFLANRAELETWVTHRFPIRDAAEAFTLYERHAQEIVKAVLDASSWETNDAR